MTCSKKRIKFSNQQVYWYFCIVGWGKTGPAQSSPLQNVPISFFPLPPKFLDLSIYCLVFRFMLLFTCIWTILNDLFQREIKFLTNKLIGTSTLWGGEKLGGPILSPSKMLGSFYLSSRLLDYSILLLYLNSLDLYQAENQVFKPTSLFVIVGWGKTGPAHSFPPH